MERYVHCPLTRIIYLAVGLNALSACAQEGDALVLQRADSAGIEIVRSSGSDRALQWEFHRLFELGGSEEGPEAFFRVSTQLVGADAAGNLFVLDPENARIVVFDTYGRFLRSMGRRGGGPGEFQSPGSMSVSPEGAVAVFDYGKGGLVRFDENGNVDVELPFPLYPTPNRQRHFKQFHDMTLASTTIFGSGANSQNQLLRQIVDDDTLVLAELPLPPAEMAMFEHCGGGVRLPPIFSPEVAWDAQQGTIAVSLSTEYSISIREGGNLTRIVRREIAPMHASRDLAITHIGEEVSFNFGRGPCPIDPAEMVDKRGYAEVIPLIGNVFLSPSGELWVQRFTVDRGAVVPIDVFDVRGAYLGTLERESFSPVVLLPGERAAVTEKDEFDVERLVILSIQR